MKNICNTVRLYAVLIMLCSMSAGAFAQIATINGGLSTTFATYTANPGSTPFSLSDAGYSNDSYIGTGAVQLNISGALSSCVVTVVAFRDSTAGSLGVVQHNTGYIAGSVPGSSGICLLPWSTPSAAYPSGINYRARGAVFFKDSISSPEKRAFEYGKGMTNANGTYGINLGIGNSDGNSRVLDTAQDGYYTVQVNFNNGGSITTQTFSFIVQHTVTASFMSAATFTTSTSSCSSRPASSILTLVEPHLGKPSTISAQPYKNGAVNGSAIPYSDPGGYTAGGPIYPSFTPPAITVNGTYYVRYSQNFIADTFLVGTTKSEPFGVTVYSLPLLSATFYEADMTGTSPITFTLSAGNPPSPYAPNTVSNRYNICQYAPRTDSPSLNIISPLYLTVAGTNTSTSVTMTATLTRYDDSMFTVLHSPSFAPVIFNTSGGIDGIYDLTTLVSNYLQNASNSGYYQLYITTSATTCGLAATQKNYYIYWAGPPVGNLLIGKRQGTALATSNPTPAVLGATSGVGSSCSNPIVACYRYYNVCIGNSTGNTGVFQGFKMKLEWLSNANCTSPAWTTVFDGTVSGYAIDNYNGGNWSSILEDIVNYTDDVDATGTFSNNYNTYWGYGGTYRLTVQVFNTVCTAAPQSLVTYIQKAGTYSTFNCKTEDETGISDIIGEPFSVTCSPNPAQHQIGFTIQGKASQLDVKIYDLLGQQVFSKTLSKTWPDEEKFHVNVDNLATGTYIYQIINSTTNEKARGNFIKTE